MLGDSIDDQIYNRIIGEIERIDPDIITITHTPGTNVIYVLAHWNEAEVDERIANMQTIANVKNVIVRNKKYVRHIMEPSLNISESVSWILKRDPIGDERIVVRCSSVAPYLISSLHLSPYSAI